MYVRASSYLVFVNSVVDADADAVADTDNYVLVARNTVRVGSFTISLMPSIVAGAGRFDAVASGGGDNTVRWRSLR